MSPDHQVDEQLKLAILSTVQLYLKAFLDCLVLYFWISIYIVRKTAQNVGNTVNQLPMCDGMTAVVLEDCNGYRSLHILRWVKSWIIRKGVA